MTQDEVLNFWFEELEVKDWFVKNELVDAQINSKFGALHSSAAQGELAPWRSSLHGRLAEVIVLDQFSRNLYRDSPLAFASDVVALVLAQEAIQVDNLNDLSANEKSFLYMPFMHSESLQTHEQAVQLFSEPGLENNMDFEIKHKKIIDQFGRYPHRNELLGRVSTPEELNYLASGGATF